LFRHLPLRTGEKPSKADGSEALDCPNAGIFASLGANTPFSKTDGTSADTSVTK